jgi:hypothetical protein
MEPPDRGCLLNFLAQQMRQASDSGGTDRRRTSPGILQEGGDA